jgi:hypothetical protein
MRTLGQRRSGAVLSIPLYTCPVKSKGQKRQDWRDKFGRWRSRKCVRPPPFSIHFAGLKACRPSESTRREWCPSRA